MAHSPTLHQLFESKVKKYPHHIAVIFNQTSLTYEQLNHKANQFAHYLIEHGVTPDTLIAVFLERSVDFLIAVLGILKAGGAYIPLDVTYPDERVSLILKDAGSPLVITSSAHKKKFISKKTLIFINNENIKKQPTSNPTAPISPTNLAYVIYTSGSTGTPKGVLIEHDAVVNYALWFSQQYQHVEKVDFSSNHAFDLAVTLYLVPLVLGLTVVICTDTTKKEPKHYLNYLAKNAIDFIKLTPSYFKVLIHEIHNKPIKLPHLKKIMLGGENLSKIECDAWLSLYPHHVLYNEYGPTETTVAVTAFAVDKHNIKALEENIPIGTLATNTYAYILDNELNPVRKGETGELYIGGRSLARGYLNRPELTEQYFIKDPFANPKGPARLYKTGDVCRLKSESIFECLGRADHQIKIRGFKVAPDEIENYLAAHPGIKAAVVIASEYDQKEKRLIAYYIPKDPNTVLQTRDLIHHLQRYLPQYMIPAAFMKMESFPLNGNDKLDRAALPLPQFISSHRYAPAKNRIEKLLAGIWSEALGVNPIGINDDFFELGGHSLSAALIISKINHQLKKEISLADFYANATISALIPIIKKAKIIDNKRVRFTKKLNNDTAVFPLSDFQFMLWISNTFEPKAKRLNIFSRKRVEGRLDLTRLNLAFKMLLQKHEVLSYQVSKFRPRQYLVKNTPFTLTETSLDSLSEKQREKVLEDSAHQLINYSNWNKDTPKIMIRLFHLKDEISELQFCIPHIISDGLSSEILLSDLSTFYNSEHQHTPHAQDKSYRNYLIDEQLYLKKYLKRDISFWDEYLKDACLYSFPPEYVIKDMQAQNYTYSTHIEIQEQHLMDLSSFCARNHISTLDGLCAIVALALKNCSSVNQDLSMCMNRVKSTRESQDYENTIGCFLRIEPIKLTVSEKTNLPALSQAIQQAVVNTHFYQGCPNLVKLASIGTFRKDNNRMKTTFAKSFFWLYSLIFQTQVYYKTLRVLERLNTFKGNHFLININMQTNFLMNSQKESERLFGLKEQQTPPYQYDLLNINNLFDVTFMRMPESKNLFLIISANLEPDYRKKIGTEMIRLMKDELSETRVC